MNKFAQLLLLCCMLTFLPGRVDALTSPADTFLQHPPRNYIAWIKWKEHGPRAVGYLVDLTDSTVLIAGLRRVRTEQGKVFPIHELPIQAIKAIHFRRRKQLEVFGLVGAAVGVGVGVGIAPREPCTSSSSINCGPGFAQFVGGLLLGTVGAVSGTLLGATKKKVRFAGADRLSPDLQRRLRRFIR